MDKHMTAAADPVSNNEYLRILVIDDSLDDRELYSRLLKKRNDINFEIYETDNAKDGLNIGHEKNPDCIIVDYQLPGDNGIEFIQAYKENNGDSATAIIMVTGHGNEAAAVEAMKLGALDYIQKSQIPEDFFVQNILNTIEHARLKEKIVRYQQNLEKSNKALLEFAHTAAHDLKGPARHIASYCELLKDSIGTQLSSDSLAYIDRMMVNAHRLQKLIDDLLDYSRAMHSKEEKKEVDLGKVIHDIPDDLETMILDNNAVIITDKLPTISAYPLRINQLFQNLISNAIKYRNQDDPIITISCNDKGKFYQFSIHDNGMGIDKEYQEVIFKPFQRLHTQEKIEGTGLGLAICKKAVNMHNGKIWVESKTGEGSTFHFTIQKE
jgi:signal transduction histidine kinase